MTKNEAIAELGLSQTYTESELKKAYRILAKKYHPDLNGGSDTKFKRIALAYDILTGKREADKELFSTYTEPVFRKRTAKNEYTHKSIFNFETV